MSIIKQNIQGVLLLDKPIGMTSNAALQKVKHLLGIAKAGHTGSLDPLASGMLPLCFGEATKFSQFLLEANKVYRVQAKLGIKTTTGDAEGEILQQRVVPSISQEYLLSILQQFHGLIEQIPSMYSAIKHQGQPLYKLARQGIAVERKSRQINIYELKLLELTTNTFDFEVHCSKGTYVRTLVEDIGEKLECGAHVSQLRRLSVGHYISSQMVRLEVLEQPSNLEQHLLSIGSIMNDWKEVQLSEAAAFYLRRGEAIIAPYAPTSGWVKLIMKSGRFLGVGEILSDGRVAPRRLVQN